MSRLHWWKASRKRSLSKPSTWSRHKKANERIITTLMHITKWNPGQTRVLGVDNRHASYQLWKARQSRVNKTTLYWKWCNDRPCPHFFRIECPPGRCEQLPPVHTQVTIGHNANGGAQLIVRAQYSSVSVRVSRHLSLSPRALVAFFRALLLRWQHVFAFALTFGRCGRVGRPHLHG